MLKFKAILHRLLLLTKSSHLTRHTFTKKKSARLLSVLFFVALSAAIAACSTANETDSLPNAPTQPTTTAHKTKVLRIHIGTHPDLLDPQKASSSAEIAVLQLAYEGLVRLDEKGKPLPAAAQSWEFSDNGKTLTFHLRSDLIRADGASLHAQDFEYAFKRALDPRTIAPDESFLDDVKGAVAAYSMERNSKPDDIQKALDNVGIVSADDQTLVFSFNQPAGYFPTIASTWIGFPAERSKIEGDPVTWWIKPENHNGNGAFKIAEIQDQVVKLVRNPYYEGGGARIERVEIYSDSDSEPSNVIDGYRKGNYDIALLSNDDLGQALKDSSLSNEIVRVPAARVTYLGFNVKKPPFSDKAARLAFSQALDREAFVRDVLKGIGKPTASWIPPGIPGNDPSITLPGFDAKTALATLATSAYGTPDKKRVDCNKLGTVKLSYSDTARNQSVFQFIVGSVARSFGCPILLDPIEPKDYPLMLRDARNPPQVFLITWEQEYAHPQDWLFLQACNGAFAVRIGYCNKDFDAALVAANQELDWDRAMEKYRAAQRIFVNDAAGAFLWNSENAYLVKPYIRGAKEHASTSDTEWLGQFGPIVTYDIDLGKVGSNYPN